MKHIYLIDTKLIAYYLYQRNAPISGLFDKIAQILWGFPKGEIYCGWDIGKSSHRLSISSSYKGHRDKQKEALSKEKQQELIDFNKAYIQLSEFADKLPIHNLRVQGVETDDVLSIIAKMYENKDDYKVFMVTGDMDYCHSVVGTSNVNIIDVYNSCEVIDHNAVLRKYGLDTRRKFSVLKSIQGDKSDNIKFCRNLGEVKAKEVFDMIYEKYQDPTDDEIVSIIEKYLNDKEEDRVKRKLKTSITVHEDHVKDGRTTPREAFLANMSIADPFISTESMTPVQQQLFIECFTRSYPKTVDFNEIFNSSLVELGFPLSLGYKACKVFNIL